MHAFENYYSKTLFRDSIFKKLYLPTEFKWISRFFLILIDKY